MLPSLSAVMCLQKTLTDLSIMTLCPLYFLQKITEVSFEWNIVFPWQQAFVKVLIVLRLLLENNRIPSNQVWESISCNCAIDVNLILALQHKQ